MQVTKRFRLSWLTNSALVYEPKCGGRDFGASTNKYSCAHEVQINFGDLTPYLTYAYIIELNVTCYPTEYKMCIADPSLRLT